MPVTPKQPGVYIEELAGLSLSINSNPTAVPVFASNNTVFNNKLAGSAVKPTDAKRINSWLEFTELMIKLGDNGSSDEVGFKFNPVDNLHLSMRTYFENGGGYCHIVDVAKLEAEVPKLDDVTLIVAAGADIKSQVTKLCSSGGTCFAIFDGPNPAEASTDEAFKAQATSANYPKNRYAAAYYPWLYANWADTKDEQGKVIARNPIPPSAAVAGAYCKVDMERGVWKAPANVELYGGVTPAVKVSDDTQAAYMGTGPGPSINMIRQFLGTGTTIWGARTLDANSDDWRYIPVRRLFNTAERDIKKAMNVAMFEPNSQPTWERVRAAIDNYLYGIWKQGGLMGNTEKEAYFVKIGLGPTMTDDDIKQGKMIVKVGMAAVRPAEFIILQFTQDMVQS